MPTARQVFPQQLNFGRRVGTGGPKIDHDCTVPGNCQQCRRLDGAIIVADRLDCQLKPVEPIRRRFQYVRTARLTTQRLDVTVMYMTWCVMLAVSGDEANCLNA